MSLSDSDFSSEQTFFSPLILPEHAVKTYPYGYQHRLYMPENVFGVYVHNTVTGKTAFALNKLYYDSGYELRAVNVVWQKMFDFHLQVLSGDIIPREGDILIWNNWKWEDCRTHLLPPPNAKWIIPIPAFKS
jgi:hypothetical protein